MHVCICACVCMHTCVFVFALTCGCVHVGVTCCSKYEFNVVFGVRKQPRGVTTRRDSYYDDVVRADGRRSLMRGEGSVEDSL